MSYNPNVKLNHELFCFKQQQYSLNDEINYNNTNLFLLCIEKLSNKILLINLIKNKNTIYLKFVFKLFKNFFLNVYTLLYTYFNIFIFTFIIIHEFKQFSFRIIERNFYNINFNLKIIQPLQYKKPYIQIVD